MLHNCCHPSNTFTPGQNVWKQRLPAINLSTFVKAHLIKQQDSALQADVEGEMGGDFLFCHSPWQLKSKQSYNELARTSLPFLPSEGSVAQNHLDPVKAVRGKSQRWGEAEGDKCSKGRVSEDPKCAKRPKINILGHLKPLISRWYGWMKLLFRHMYCSLWWPRRVIAFNKPTCLPGEFTTPRAILTGHDCEVTCASVCAELGLVISGCKGETRPSIHGW